jgi:hypothetical protein
MNSSRDSAASVNRPETPFTKPLASAPPPVRTRIEHPRQTTSPCIARAARSRFGQSASGDSVSEQPTARINVSGALKLTLISTLAHNGRQPLSISDKGGDHLGLRGVLEPASKPTEGRTALRITSQCLREHPKNANYSQSSLFAQNRLHVVVARA